MYKLKKNELYVSEIAKYLNNNYYGEDIVITNPEVFGEKLDNIFYYLEETEIEKIKKINNKVLLFTTEKNNCKNENVTFIISNNPKKDFYLVVNEFYVQAISHKIHKSAYISKDAIIGINVNIGRNTEINAGVFVGNNTYIGNNVSVTENSIIGSDCVIKDGVIIGSDRFDFIKDGNEIIHVPQFGRVKIKDSVWIGSNTTIEKPFLGETNINSNVKIDDLVHIGQGVIIGDGSTLTSGVVIGNDVKIAENVFFGINSSVKPNIKIGKNVVVGMGSVVIREIEDEAKYAGVPAKKI